MVSLVNSDPSAGASLLVEQVFSMREAEFTPSTQTPKPLECSFHLSCRPLWPLPQLEFSKVVCEPPFTASHPRGLTSMELFLPFPGDAPPGGLLYFPSLVQKLAPTSANLWVLRVAFSANCPQIPHTRPRAWRDQALPWGGSRGAGQRGLLALSLMHHQRDTAGWAGDRNGNKRHRHTRRHLSKSQLEAAGFLGGWCRPSLAGATGTGAWHRRGGSWGSSWAQVCLSPSCVGPASEG